MTTRVAPTARFLALPAFSFSPAARETTEDLEVRFVRLVKVDPP